MKCQNLRDTAKAIVKRKFITLNREVRPEEKTKINHLSFHLWKLQKEKQFKPRASRRKIVEIIREINETEGRRAIEEINKTKSWLF